MLKENRILWLKMEKIRNNLWLLVLFRCPKIPMIFMVLENIVLFFKMFKVTWLQQANMTSEIESKIQESSIPVVELISHFREKCKICGHHRIMHNELGVCEGVMNKPCTSGCDSFESE